MERDLNPHLDHPYPQENWVELDIKNLRLIALDEEEKAKRLAFRNMDYEWKSKRGGNSTIKAPHVPIIEANKGDRPFKRSLKAEGHFALKNKRNAEVKRDRE